MFHLHDIAVLAAETSVAGRGALALPWHAVACDDIARVHADLGHRLRPERAERRLANGLRFLRFELDGATVASTWLAGTTGRYLDEFNWLAPMAADECWLRDVFVAPSRRGQRLFARVVATLANGLERPMRRVLSDVDWDNPASMHAHRSAGFEVIARARCLDLRGRIRLRGAPPAALGDVREIAPEARLLLLHGQHHARHVELVA